MVFLKAIIFIFWNLIAGYLIIFTAKALLFYPKKELHYRHKKIPFTPGFAYRKKDWLINKIKKMLSDYINDCSSNNENTKVAEWENKVYQKAWDKFGFIDKIKIIPRKLRDNIHHFFALIFYELTKQFLRTFVPYLMEKFDLKKYVELVSQKLDVDIILGYFNKYVYKYLLIFSLSFFFLVGFGNMILYLIIH